jgi:hypothetical protein
VENFCTSFFSFSLTDLIIALVALFGLIKGFGEWRKQVLIKHFEKAELGLVSMLRFISAIRSVCSADIIVKQEEDETMIENIVNDRNFKMENASKDIDSFIKVCDESYLYLPLKMIEVSEQLSNIWRDVRVGFRLYLLSLSRRDFLPSDKDAFNNAFAIKHKDRINELESLIKEEMKKLNQISKVSY